MNVSEYVAMRIQNLRDFEEYWEGNVKQLPDEYPEDQTEEEWDDSFLTDLHGPLA